MVIKRSKYLYALYFHFIRKPLLSVETTSRPGRRIKTSTPSTLVGTYLETPDVDQYFCSCFSSNGWGPGHLKGHWYLLLM